MELLACFGVVVQQFLTYLGGASAIISVIIVILRKMIVTAFSEYISSKAQRTNFVFEQIIAKKIDSISKLYEASVLASNATTYIVGMQGNVEPERIRTLERDVKNFSDQYKLSRLWLPSDVCVVIDKLLDQHSAFYKVVRGARLKESGLGNELDVKMLSLLERADKDLPIVQTELCKSLKIELLKISQ